MISTRRKQHGFTIVELLIVIVVIGILAAITIVAYNGIQQRATNTSIVETAGKTMRLIDAYIAVNQKFPVTPGARATFCATSKATCATGIANTLNATYQTEMATIGQLPESVPSWGTTRYGLVVSYEPTRTFNGESKPFALYYWLKGAGQQCVLQGVANMDGTGEPIGLTSSTTGYTVADDAGTGKTVCVVSINTP